MATVLVSQHVMKLYEKYKKRNFPSRPSNNEALISSTSFAPRIFVEREKRRYIYYILSHFVKLSRCDNPAPYIGMANIHITALISEASFHSYERGEEKRIVSPLGSAERLIF